MSVIRQDLEDFEAELQKVIDKFEKDHGMFIVDINYDGFTKNINYTFAGEKLQIHKR